MRKIIRITTRIVVEIVCEGERQVRNLDGSFSAGGHCRSAALSTQSSLTALRVLPDKVDVDEQNAGIAGLQLKSDNIPVIVSRNEYRCRADGNLKIRRRDSEFNSQRLGHAP